MENQNKEHRHILFAYYRILRTREFIESFQAERSWAALQERIQQRQLQKRRIIRRTLSTAAIITLLLGGGYLGVLHSPWTQPDDTPQQSRLFPERGGQFAYLTLADGREIDLSQQQGEIEGKVSNLNRELSYRAEGAGEGDSTLFHTLTVPRGGEYRLLLADGSRVWMNAGSQLRYPERFGQKREVYLSGEAYFEVAKDSTRPFKVYAPSYEVEVLGTTFNMTAYENETGRTTLAGGSVKVTCQGEETVLHPNEQAIMEDNRIQVVQVDAGLYTSWIQGKYVFRNTELKDIAAQLSRWFSTDILFRDESLMHRRFAGTIMRDADLEFAIEIISRVARVKFVREGPAIYIENE